MNSLPLPTRARFVSLTRFVGFIRTSGPSGLVGIRDYTWRLGGVSEVLPPLPVVPFGSIPIRLLEVALPSTGYVEAAGCSRRDVSVVKKMVTARGITAGLAESLTDTDVQALFPDGRKRVSDEYESPDYAGVLRSMKANRHFTLPQAWRKYIGAGGRRNAVVLRKTSHFPCGWPKWSLNSADAASGRK